NYTHRSGRTARAGRSGVSIIIGASLRKIKMIEQQVGITIKSLAVPTGEQICQKQLEHFSHELANATVDQAVKPHVDAMQALQSLTKEELIERIFAMKCGALVRYYKQDPNLSAPTQHIDLSVRVHI